MNNEEEITNTAILEIQEQIIRVMKKYHMKIGENDFSYLFAICSENGFAYANSNMKAVLALNMIACIKCDISNSNSAN